MKLRILAAAVLAAVVGLGAVAARGDRTRVVVEPGELKARMLGRAVVSASDGPALVHAEVEGRVVRVAVRVGDRVKAGDLLAELDPSTLENEVARLLAEARALASSKRSVAEGARPEERAIAEAELAAARADLAFADKRAARTAGLVASGAMSPADAEQETKAKALAAARVASAEARLRLDTGGGRNADVASAQARAEAAEAALRQARGNLAKSRLTAPIDGVVLARRISVGDTARVSSPPAFEIADVGRVEVRVEVGEDEAGPLVPGLRSRVLRSGGAVVAEGRVGRVSAQLEGRTVGFDEARLRGDARVRVAWLELDREPASPLIVGQLLEAEIALPPRRVDARLPREAVKVREGRAVVDVAWGPFRRELPVRVGTADDAFVETLGLGVGTWVLAR